MSIGERISTLRKEHNISQVQLAKVLEVSRQAVSKWENDQSSPDTINLIKLSEILETEVEFLATGVKPVYQEPPIVVNMVEKVDRVIEKVVEKPIVKKVTRVKYLRNPIEFIIWGSACFIVGFLIGLLI